MKKMKIVYVLIPDSASCQIVVLDTPSEMALLRFLMDGGDAPEFVSGQWGEDDPDLPACDFPCYGRAPIVSKRVQTVFSARLAECGKFLPVLINGVETGQCVFLVTKFVSCLDMRRSSKIKRNGSISKLELIDENVDADVAAFRIPEIPEYTFWNRSFVDDLMAIQPIGVEALVAWAGDRSLARHPHALR